MYSEEQYLIEKNKILSYYIAVGVMFNIVDNMIPYPVAGIKLGLANVVTLFVLSTIGPIEAIKVALFRPIVTSIITGSFVSPMFVISFISSVLSTILMVVVKFLLGKVLSNIGISVIGAVGHNLCQLMVVYFLFFNNNKSIFLLLPLLVLAGTIFGIITGYLVNSLSFTIPEKKVFKIKFRESEIRKENIILVSKEKWLLLGYTIVFFGIIISFVFVKEIKLMMFILIFAIGVKIFSRKFIVGVRRTDFKFDRKNFFVFIIIGILVINIFSVFLYGYSYKQVFVLATNIIISVLKLLTFVILSEEFFSLNLWEKLFKKLPVIFYSVSFINDIISQANIKEIRWNNFVSLLEKFLVKDVFEL